MPLPAIPHGVGGGGADHCLPPLRHGLQRHDVGAGAVEDREDLRRFAELNIVERCVREGRESQLEPWLAAQPPAARTSLRAEVAKLKAEPGK